MRKRPIGGFKPTWKTKEGKVVAIRDMTDSHLKNTVAMLRRNVGAFEATIRDGIWGYLVGDPPDGAAMAAEGALAELDEADDDDIIAACVDVFPLLVKETKKRGLPT